MFFRNSPVGSNPLAWKTVPMVAAVTGGARAVAAALALAITVWSTVADPATGLFTFLSTTELPALFLLS